MAYVMGKDKIYILNYEGNVCIMKKVIAGILAVLCVMGTSVVSRGNSAKKTDVKSSSYVTAFAADETVVPEPGFNAGLYSYEFADTSRYTTKFTAVSITPDPDDKKNVYKWKSEDGKYDYGIYKVEVNLLGEKEPVLTEYVVGITKANENVIETDLSVELDKDPQVEAFINNEGIDIDWRVEYLHKDSFKDSYLKTINLDGVKYIGDSVFAKCEYITDITIPDSVLYVGKGVFSESGLKTLSVQNEMPVIPESLCSKTKLTNIEFAHPELIHTIGKSAFQGSAVSAPLFMTSYGDDISGYEPLVVEEKAYADCTSIESVDVADNVTTIGIGAFSGCTSVTSLTCGNSLLAIDKEGFKGCTALNDIKFNDILMCLGGGAFQGCTSLKKVEEIPETVGDWVVVDPKTKEGYGFGDGVFSNCKSLTQCDLPQSITIIPDSTFENCTSLTKVSFSGSADGENILTIGSKAFSKCESMLETEFANVVVIEPSAYAGCKKLQQAKFPKAVYIGGTEDDEANERGIIVSKELNLTDGNDMGGGGSTFADCTELKTVDIPSALYIFPSSFKNCLSMTTLNVGKCEIVGNYALDGCSAMKEITLLSKQYGNSAPTKSNKTNGFVFQNCSGAETITIDAKFLVEFPNKTPNGFFNGCSSLKTIKTENGDFKNVTVVSNKTFSGCSSLEELDLEEILIVEDDAFSNCTSLKKISSAENNLKAEDYGKNSFLNCSELKFTITGDISTIGDNAFKNSGVTAVDLTGMAGGTVVIGNNAFSDCANLSFARILSDNAAKFSIGSGVFANCPVLNDAVYEGTIITSKMFQNCPSLEYLTTNAKNIKANAFEGDALLKMLKDMNDENSSVIAEEINAAAFKDCISLEVIPADVHTVLSGSNIFMNCASIEKADVGALTDGIFSGCASLKDVTMTDVAEIPKNAFTNCSSLEDIDISEMVNIGANAFSGSGLVNVKINNAQLIDSGSFANCNSLKSIDIVATTIGSKAFSNSEFLEDAVLNVDKVQANAFDGCSSLRNVTFQSGDSHSLTELGNNVFNNCTVLYELILQGNPKMGSKCVGFVSNKVNGDFILVGETGSTVEEYATANKIEFCDINDFDLEARQLARNVPGDIDGNTIVSVADAVKLQSWLLNKSATGIIPANMDLNDDGAVDSFDMIYMRKKLLSK